MEENDTQKRTARLEHARPKRSKEPNRLNFSLDTEITTKDRFKALSLSKDTEIHHLRKN